MQRTGLLAMLALLVAALWGAGRSGAQQGEGGGRPGAQLPPARIGATLPAARVSTPERQGDFPALAAAADGSLWAAWVEWDGKRDRILAARRAPEAEGAWGAPVVVWEGSELSHAPALAAAGTGAAARVWCIWSAFLKDDWELLARPLAASGPLSPVERLTSARHPDFNCRAAGDRGGNLVVAWQSFRRGNGDIFFRRRSPAGRWGREILLSEDAANEWEPDIALAGGRAFVVWDTYRAGDYDVALRAVGGETPGPELTVAGTPAAEFHACVAVDPQGRAWVAWDEAGPNWGKDFSPGSGVAAPGSAGLHSERHLGLRIVAGDQLLEPPAPLAPVLTGRMERFAELPRLAFDSGGTPILVFRHWTAPTPTETYHFYATRLTPQGWTLPDRLDQSAGRNTQHADTALTPDGRLWAIYAGDGRGPGVMPPSISEALKYGVFAAELSEGTGEGGNGRVGEVGHSPGLKSRADETKSAFADSPGRSPRRRTLFRQADTLVPEPPAAFPHSPILPFPTTRPDLPARQRMSVRVGGRTYQLLYGDLHRHTDIRGHSGVDGSIEDSYRYALDAAGLDFLGVTDHNQAAGGRWPDGLRDYQWWWTQKAADLFYFPPRFMGIYAYEHSLATPAGHRNLVFADRGGPLRAVDREQNPDDNLPPNMWAFFQGRPRTVDIPHTFGEQTQPRARWDWPNPGMEALLEIYQGDRSSYERLDAAPGEKRGKSQLPAGPHFAVDALAKGYRYGFIASSDHASTHNSYACVWTDPVTRAGLVDALLARRTYAASDDIILSATLNDRMPGEAFTLGDLPRLTVWAEAPNDLLRVDLVKDGTIVYTARPGPAGTRRLEFRWTDLAAAPGEHYYYVRLMQKDAEAPNGDPEMAWASPFFVTQQ